MRIYLIGYMASGKTQIGHILANRLGFSFTDLDSVFEKQFRISVSDFFEKYDEHAFRLLEQKLLLETKNLDNIVISTGGGTPCFFDNMDFIRQSGISVYLKWDLQALLNRIKKAKRKRPLLRAVPPEELEEWVKAHLARREAFYLNADLIVPTREEPSEQLINRILDGLKVLMPQSK